MYLYHITTEENWKQIQKTGLVAQIGERAKQCREEKPYVYLCRRKDVGYWKLILGLPVVIQVEGVNPNDCESFEYDEYTEYRYEHAIAPDKLKRVWINTTGKQHDELCISYLYSLSRLVYNICYHYCREADDMEELQDLKTETSCYLRALSHMDYKRISDKKLRAELTWAAKQEGAITFCDMFNDMDRLWEQLPEFPEDDFAKERKQLYEWMTTNFSKRVLHTDTGGCADILGN